MQKKSVDTATQHETNCIEVHEALASQAETIQSEEDYFGSTPTTV